MTNRKKTPEIKAINKVEVPDLIPVAPGFYLVPGGDQEVFKLEAVFQAGTVCGSSPLNALYTNKLLLEGTTTKTSEMISNLFDYHGAHVNSYCEKDFAGISVIALNKTAREIIPLIGELIYDSVFPVNEFEILNQKQKQHFLVNSQKVRFLAKEHFLPLIFGENNAYGKLLGLEYFDNINREDVLGFYTNYYKHSGCVLILSGKFDDNLIGLVQDVFKGNEVRKKTIPSQIETDNYPSPGRKRIIRNNALQSAIRIGRIAMDRKSEDYIPMRFLSTILGGYFGSRLMTNLREDKGYTYGIGSNVLSMKNAGYFVISTEVGAHFEEDALREIYYEIQKISENRVPDEEMALVKSYLMGSFLHSIDGPFNLASNYRGLLLDGLDKSFFEFYLQQVNEMNSGKVMETAGKYLDPGSLSELVVGK